MNPDSIAQDDTRDAARDELYRLVDEVAALSEAQISAADFFRQLLQRSVQAMAALSGAVWLHQDGVWRCVQSTQIGKADDSSDERSRNEHYRALDALCRRGRCEAIAPRAISEDGLRNPSEHTLLATPILHRGEMRGVIEIFHRAALHPTVQRGNLRLLQMLAEIASDYDRNQELAALRQREAEREILTQFACAVHQHLDLRATAFAVANESRRVLACDRVTLIRLDQRRPKVLAVSGVDTAEPRSNAVQQLQLLAKLVRSTGQALWYGTGTEPLPPDITECVQRYVDERHVRSLAVIPLAPDAGKDVRAGPPLAAIVIECFNAELDQSTSARLRFVCQHSLIALRNATEIEQIPCWRALRWLSKTTAYLFIARLPRTLLVALLLTALLVALFLTPTTFSVQARGELQPVSRQYVFAPVDGQIVDLSVHHNQTVDAGDELAQLRSSELEVAIQRLAGELETTAKRLEAIASQRVIEDREARTGNRRSELAAEEEQLKISRDSQQKQLDILSKQREQLVLRSPLTGHVLTWNVDQLLAARPVRRGQALLVVADMNGPWSLELHVRDDQIDHVLSAWRDSQQAPTVSFIVGNAPEAVYQGVLKEIAGNVSVDATDEPTVMVTVDVDAETFRDMRPGTTAVAKIQCGRVSIGYAWLHELLEAAQTWAFF